MKILNYYCFGLFPLIWLNSISCESPSRKESAIEIAYIQKDTARQNDLMDSTIQSRPKRFDTLEIVSAEKIIKEDQEVKVPVKRAKIEFDSLTYHAGQILEGDVISNNFYFTNIGDAPLSIKKAEVSCGCTVPSVPFLDVAPNERGFIGVEFHSVGKLGQQNPQVEVYSNGSPSKMTLTIDVEVVPKT